jgi:hypothetical protein
VFPNAKYALFDVVNHNPGFPNNQRNDLVQFISAADSNAVQYDRKWVFNQDGVLVSSFNLAADRIFNNNNEGGYKEEVSLQNFSQYKTTGFYNAEDGIRWTNGDASITLNSNIENRDSLMISLDTYMPPVCKDVVPKIFLVDSAGRKYEPVFSSRKQNLFHYLFTELRDRKINTISIVSEKVNALPDQRILSFPFISLVIK